MEKLLTKRKHRLLDQLCVQSTSHKQRQTVTLWRHREFDACVINISPRAINGSREENMKRRSLVFLWSKQVLIWTIKSKTGCFFWKQVVFVLGSVAFYLAKSCAWEVLNGISKCLAIKTVKVSMENPPKALSRKEPLLSQAAFQF